MKFVKVKSMYGFIGWVNVKSIESINIEKNKYLRMQLKDSHSLCLNDNATEETLDKVIDYIATWSNKNGSEFDFLLGIKEV